MRLDSFMDKIYLVVKRNGETVPYDKVKVMQAIQGANNEAPKELQLQDLEKVVTRVDSWYKEVEGKAHVEEIQDYIEDILLEEAPQVAKRFIKYRETRRALRDDTLSLDSIRAINKGSQDEVGKENSNKNQDLLSTKRDLIAGDAIKALSFKDLMSEDVAEAHKKGIVHFHDTDYAAMDMYNCSLVNLEDMFTNGTVVSDVKIDTPNSFHVACNVATQIVAQVASSQYGGQSITLSHLAPYVDVSRKKFKERLIKDLFEINITLEDKQINDLVEKQVLREIKDGVQTIQYQLSTLMTTNGQTPFISVFMYLNEVEDKQTKDDLALVIEEVLRQRIKGLPNEQGVYVTPAFPKLIYVLEEDNIHNNSPYYYLTELSAKCSAKRLVPDYISEKIMKREKVDINGEGQCYPVMGCRSALTPYVDSFNRPKYYGRFNQGVNTLNLPYIALESLKEDVSFYTTLDKYLEIAKKGLLQRHEHLKGVKAKVAPILWQHGAIARLDAEDTIEELLYGGYSTISLGFAGLNETVRALTNENILEPNGEAKGLEIMEYLNNKCDEWKREYDIDFSLYGTPLESSTERFAKAMKRDFGEIEGVSDKPYVTNSYHIHVTQEVDAFTKLAHEAKFQALAPGGAISYVETSDLQGNIDAVISIIKYIYDTILYAELNTKSDYCLECGYDGEMVTIEQGGELLWKCPHCECINQDKLYVTRRTCGYIGTEKWNYGRTSEIQDRFIHVSVPTKQVKENFNPSKEHTNEIR